MIGQKQKVVKKTRKEHMCLKCGNMIPVGSEALHVHTFVLNDEEYLDQFLEYYYCSKCFRGKD